MGGAGLAVIRRPTAQAFQNPAVIAYVQGFRFGAGNIDTTCARRVLQPPAGRP
jgi:hypothetical protein